MAGIVSKDIHRLVKTTTTEIDIMDRIYHGDVDAYNIDIEFYGVISISGTCNLHFVLPDGTALDKDASDGVVIDGNNVKYTLPTYLYQQSGNLTMYVQFMNSNIYTPLKVNFKNIVAIPDGGDEVVATTTYPVWYDDAKEAETARATWEEFNAAKVYAVGEKVYYPTTGSSYILHTASGVANTLPTDTDYWQKITDKGDTGEQGIQGIQGEDGNGIVSIVRTSGTGAAGTTDTYTITYDDATTSTFNVYNGADGKGAGDMLASIYDPNTVNGDAFDTDNHVSGTINKVFTAIEQTKLSGIDEGTRTYTEQNYVTNGETVTASIDALDIAVASAGSGITVVDTYPSSEDGEDGDVYAVKGTSGVWTPTITIGGSSTGITYGEGQSGFYWIVGKLLFWICEVQFDKASLSGAINLLGFPVNTSSSRPYPAINVSQFSGIDSPTGALGLFILHNGGSNIGMMRFNLDNNSWSDFTTSHMYASTAFFRAQGFYQID